MPAPNQDFAGAACGSIHSLGLRQDGTIVAWGNNESGQCDVPDSGPFLMVAAGGFYGLYFPPYYLGHSLALREDSSIVAWGSNEYGQCDVPETQ